MGAVLTRNPPRKVGAGIRAFTLIELLIVVAIIAILAAIAVPNFLEAQVRSKVSRAKADMRSVATALEAYRTDFNRYPADGVAYNSTFGTQPYQGVAADAPVRTTPLLLAHDAGRLHHKRSPRALHAPVRPLLVSDRAGSHVRLCVGLHLDRQHRSMATRTRAPAWKAQVRVVLQLRRPGQVSGRGKQPRLRPGVRDHKATRGHDA